MPYVQIHTIKGMLNPGQKQLLLERIADVMVDIEGTGDPEFRKSIWINIQETEAENWSMSGLRPSTRHIEQFLAVREARATRQAEVAK
ncbi:tautomerase family protein [Undibacterium sp. Ji50W]|uniref:tautomerase family protein n=1 Tax=Undibacterium sp. Ji50W TaxID=3413041 RepID=UPI003BF1E3BE